MGNMFAFYNVTSFVVNRNNGWRKRTPSSVLFLAQSPKQNAWKPREYRKGPKKRWRKNDTNSIAKQYTTKIRNARSSDKAILLLGELKKKHGVDPDVYHFSAAIHVCARDGNWEYALKLLDTMKENGVKPNFYSYSSAISACDKGSQWEKALELLREMDSRGIEPDVFSYSSAISACAKGSQWEKALELLREMDSRGIEPNVVSYNSAISACDKGSQWEKALELLREMDSRGIEPNVFSYNSAISACAKGSQWEKALELLREMDSRGIEPDAISLRSAILACFSSGQFPQAYRTMRCAKVRNGLDLARIGVNCWDLRGLDLASAAMCLVDELLTIVTTTDPLKDVVVVTGKGRHSGSDGPVLNDGIAAFLREHLGLNTTPIPGNDGGLSLEAESLREFRRRITQQHPCVVPVFSKPPGEWNADDLDSIGSLFC